MLVDCVCIDLTNRCFSGSGLADKENWVFGTKGAPDESHEALHGLRPDDVRRRRNIKAKEACNVASQPVKVVKRSLIDTDFHYGFDDAPHYNPVVFTASTVC